MNAIVSSLVQTVFHGSRRETPFPCGWTGIAARRLGALGIGHWALGIGHWALGIEHWALVALLLPPLLPSY
jgi:hypothetical protein